MPRWHCIVLWRGLNMSLVIFFWKHFLLINMAVLKDRKKRDPSHWLVMASRTGFLWCTVFFKLKEVQNQWGLYWEQNKMSKSYRELHDIMSSRNSSWEKMSSAKLVDLLISVSGFLTTLCVLVVRCQDARIRPGLLGPVGFGFVVLILFSTGASQ